MVHLQHMMMLVMICCALLCLQDGSGRISLSQFVEGAKSDPIIVKALSDYEDL